jgi:hypothetical protein
LRIGVKPPLPCRSSTQWAAVRITRGAITVPVQAKRLSRSAASMKASEGKSAIEAALPPTIEAPAPLVSPGADHVRELLDLGQIGYVRGIEAKLDELAAETDNQPLVAALRTHLRNFDFDLYQTTLEGVGEHE